MSRVFSSHWSLQAKRAIIAMAGILLALLLSEAFARTRLSTDSDGNRYLWNLRLRPFKVPRELVSKNLSRLKTLRPYVTYDPLLGWSPKANSSSSDKLYHFNSQALRSAPTEYSLEPKPETVRVALFGDSFTLGADVSWTDTWAHLLEAKLKQNKIKAEVLNFGVAGYGMDQAYLRWQQDGRKFSPHIVLFGLQPENTKRNLNIFRPFYFARSGIPLFKPRFVLTQGHLELTNSPTPRPSQIPEILDNIWNWEKRHLETFLKREDYETSLLRTSALGAYLESLAIGPNWESEDKTEANELALAILNKMKQEVESSGARFQIVHLPTAKQLSQYLKDGELSPLLAALEAHRPIHCEEALALEAERVGVKKLYRGHYTPRGNETVSKTVAERIVTILRAESQNHSVRIQSGANTKQE